MFSFYGNLYVFISCGNERIFPFDGIYMFSFHGELYVFYFMEIYMFLFHMTRTHFSIA